MYRITRSRSQYIMFVGALSTMARETASNAKGPASEPVGPWVRAEAEVWLLVLLIAAGDLRPQGSMLQMPGASSTAAEPESERSGHCAPPWNLSASPGTALRESTGRVDVLARLPIGAFASRRGRHFSAPSSAIQRGVIADDSVRSSVNPAEHQLHQCLRSVCCSQSDLVCLPAFERSRFPADPEFRCRFSATLSASTAPIAPHCVVCRCAPDGLTEPSVGRPADPPGARGRKCAFMRRANGSKRPNGVSPPV